LFDPEYQIEGGLTAYPEVEMVGDGPELGEQPVHLLAAI
jgi:hypothetical protein